MVAYLNGETNLLFSGGQQRVMLHDLQCLHDHFSRYLYTFAARFVQLMAHFSFTGLDLTLPGAKSCRTV